MEDIDPERANAASTTNHTNSSPPTTTAKANEDNDTDENNVKGLKMGHFLCVTGVQQHMIEKDLNKFFRKCLSTVPVLPLKGIQKKRGTNFAFLQFENEE